MTLTVQTAKGGVAGPASATSGNIATFNGTSGKLLQDGGKALPSGAIVGTTDSQALTNKDMTGTGNSFPTDLLKYDVEAQGPATGGVNITSKDLGAFSAAGSNTITPNPGNRGIQKITNDHAGTILPGSAYGAYLLEVLNTTGAGAITTSSWTKVTGDSFGTTTTSKYLCHCTVTADYSVMIILQVA